ncbi:MAG: hypothetical protein PHR35_12225 [Kiritimatiellae bacterium]|nr:hypothetical protein [Kiritimatiellia bacterium]
MQANSGFGRLSRKLAAGAATVVLFVGTTLTARGELIYWANYWNNSGEWSDTNNWNLLRVPSIASNDSAVVYAGRTANILTPGPETATLYVGFWNGSGRVVVGPGADAYFPNLRITPGGAYYGELLVGGGTITCAGLAMLENGGPGVVQVTGGVLRVTGGVNAVQVTHIAYSYTGPQIIALGGNGRMEMVNGSASEFKIGTRPGTVARLNMSGNAVLTNLYRMTLGYATNGAFGAVSISNSAFLHMNGNLYIGGGWADDTDAEFGGTGVVTVAGGTLRAYDVVVGCYGTGELNVEGGRIQDVHDMCLVGSRGYGVVNQTGGTVDVERLYLSLSATPSNSVYNLGGGVLRVRGAVQNYAAANTVFNITGGVFSMYRWMTGTPGMPTMTNAGGIMSPALGLAGVARIETNYVETSSNCQISIDVGGTNRLSLYVNETKDPGYYDYVNVSGSVTLMGKLQVNVIDGFAETARKSDVFYVMSAGSDIAGAFSNVASGERVTTSDGHSFLVYYGNNAATTGAGMDPKKVTLTGFRHFPRGTIMCVR